MVFQVETARLAQNVSGTGVVHLLRDAAGHNQAEIWPENGWNCFRWQVVAQGQPLDLLYNDGLFGPSAKSTRGGIPILFPFPNRIRDGRFTWASKEYVLPGNDSTGKNAIHGFACRRPWRLTDQGADADNAWVTGEFHGRRDAPDSAALWPADYRLRVTYRLRAARLRVEAVVENPDVVPLPFGLGFHPYFRIPFAVGDSAATFALGVPARSFWELDGGLPTGRCQPVSGSLDLRTPQSIGALTLDDVLTDLPSEGSAHDLGTVVQLSPRRELRVRASSSFREVVVFTPPHRQAVCLEPYTCVTDAINLQARGLEAGLLVLPPGATWTGWVEILLTI
jgi:aldose 1-epimerase